MTWNRLSFRGFHAKHDFQQVSRLGSVGGFEWKYLYLGRFGIVRFLRFSCILGRWRLHLRGLRFGFRLGRLLGPSLANQQKEAGRRCRDARTAIQYTAKDIIHCSFLSGIEGGVSLAWVWFGADARPE